MQLNMNKHVIDISLLLNNCTLIFFINNNLFEIVLLSNIITKRTNRNIRKTEYKQGNLENIDGKMKSIIIGGYLKKQELIFIWNIYMPCRRQFVKDNKIIFMMIIILMIIAVLHENYNIMIITMYYVN